METIRNNHIQLKNKNKQLLKQIKQTQVEQYMKPTKSFMELDKEKNYKNNLIQTLLYNTYNNLDQLKRPKNDHYTQFLERLYKWLIDEEFDLNIIQECNYYYIINF